MAQQGSNEEDVLTLNVSNQNLKGVVKASFSNQKKLDELFNAGRQATILTDETLLRFKFQGNDIFSDWYLEMHPNGGDPWKNYVQKGDFGIYLALSSIPIANSVSIKSILVTYTTKVEAINFMSRLTSSFRDDSHLRWGCADIDNTIKMRQFKQNPDVMKNGFDIVVSFHIKSITYVKKKGIRNNNNNINIAKYNQSQNVIKNILTRLDNIESQIGLKGTVNNNNNNNESSTNTGDDNTNKNCESKENVNENLKGIKAKRSQVTGFESEKVILNIFGDNTKAGKEYVDMIVVEQGYEDVEALFTLEQDELLQYGMVKKGHRLKLLSRLKQLEQDQYAQAAQARISHHDTEGE